jgi:hypothetical protein
LEFDALKDFGQLIFAFQSLHPHLSALIDCLMARDIIRRRGHHSSVLHPG